MTLNESHIQALKETSILEISRYIPNAGRIPNTLKKFEVANNLYELYITNFEQLPPIRNFPYKKAIKLQKEFRELPEEIFNDIVFWNKKCVFPSNFDPEKDWLENVELIFEDLYDYIKGCNQRESQITNKTSRNRVSDLMDIFEDHYIGNTRLKELARRISSERLRQTLKDEFLIPLFNGEEASFFKNIAIKNDIIEYKKDFLKNYLFTNSMTNPSDFVKDALQFDIVKLNDGLGYIIVPAGEKMVYDAIYSVVINELVNIIRPIQEEELIDRINNTDKVVKEILNAGKTYNSEFIRTLIYDTDLADVTENGIIINYKYNKKEISVNN